jgi:hypothetical protein
MAQFTSIPALRPLQELQVPGEVGRPVRGRREQGERLKRTTEVVEAPRGRRPQLDGAQVAGAAPSTTRSHSSAASPTTPSSSSGPTRCGTSAPGWAPRCRSRTSARTSQIEMYNEAGQLVLAYNVFRCWVSRIPGAAGAGRRGQRRRDPDAQARERGLGARTVPRDQQRRCAARPGQRWRTYASRTLRRQYRGCCRCTARSAARQCFRRSRSARRPAHRSDLSVVWRALVGHTGSGVLRVARDRRVGSTHAPRGRHPGARLRLVGARHPGARTGTACGVSGTPLMNFLAHLLARARGDVTIVRPRRRTALEALAGPAGSPGSSEERGAAARDRATPPAGRQRSGPREPAMQPDVPAAVGSPPFMRERPVSGNIERNPGARDESSRTDSTVPSRAHGVERSFVTGQSTLTGQDALDPRSRPTDPVAVRPATSAGSLESGATGPEMADRGRSVRAADSPGDATRHGGRDAAARAPRPVPAPVARIASRKVNGESAAPAETRPESAAGAPIIRIHIGRIDVRAERETPPPKPVRPPVTPRLTLEEYARLRSRGER